MSGVTEVPITSEMMQYVKEARSKYREALEKENEETIQAAAKRKIEAESRKAWEKKVDLEQEMATSKKYISIGYCLAIRKVPGEMPLRRLSN